MSFALSSKQHSRITTPKQNTSDLGISCFGSAILCCRALSSVGDKYIEFVGSPSSYSMYDDQPV